MDDQWLFGQRYQLLDKRGQGGMGVVYRARDGQTGSIVAIKCLDTSSQPLIDRFEREALVLATLSHPAVVRYLGHGLNPQPHLVMDWLEGEDVAARLTRGPMSVIEAMTVAARVARALSHAHERGVVHRDVKPSNVVLRGGIASEATLVDFGIAKTVSTKALTQVGSVMGTPGYMSPEQVADSAAVGPPSDIFALGALMFEAVTGRPAFQGESVVALLARILVGETPATGLAHSSDSTCRAVDSLITRMLAKDPRDRPRSAAEVAGALTELLEGRTIPSTQPVSRAERRVTSVWLARRVGSPNTAREGPCEGVSASLLTAAGHEATAYQMADGTVLGVGVGEDALDRARFAVLSALAVQGDKKDVRVVVATARASSAEHVPLGEAVDRAAGLLGLTAPTGAVRIDSATAALIEAQFDIDADEHGQFTGGAAVASLSGIPRSFPRCVGRAREVSFVDSILEEVVSEGVARMVVVRGDPGVGKSRLASELSSKWAERSLTMMTARADPLGERTSFSLVAQLLRSFDLHDLASGGSPLDPSGREIHELVERVVRFARQGPTSSFGSTEAPQVSELIAGFVCWLERVLERGPLVVVLDDLHWVDPASALAVQSALERLHHAPLLVLALTRPGLNAGSESLLRALGPSELRLDVLTPRAASELAQLWLGEVEQDVVRDVVQRSGGHPLWIEQLARSRGSATFSESHITLEALVESRILRLPPEDRQVLRAASVFGVVFSRSAVTALLGARDTDARIAGLAATGWFTELEPRLGDASSPTHEFSHGIVRESAYAMLAREDVCAAHRAAAVWLEQAGERDPGLLAEHWLRGAKSDLDRVHAVRLAVRASEVSPVASATEWIRLAEIQCSSVSTHDHREPLVFDVKARLVDVLIHSDLPRALTEVEALVELAGASARGDCSARALAAKAKALALADREAASWSALEDSRRVAQALESPELDVEIDSIESLLWSMRGELSRAAEAATRTLALNPETRRGRVAAIAYHNAADYRLRLGEFDASIELLDASDRAQTRPLRVMLNRVLRVSIEAIRVGGPWRELVQRAREVHEAGCEWWIALEIGLFQAMLESQCGGAQQARELLDQLIEAASARRYPHIIADATHMMEELARSGRAWFPGGKPPSSPLGYPG